MAQDWSRKFYQSKAWQKCRDAYYLYRFGLCERCGGAGEIVHHKNYLTPDNINDPSVSLSFDNLELLCLDCHNKEHLTSDDVIREGLAFDEYGDIIKL